jgi:hypothetical protein
MGTHPGTLPNLIIIGAQKCGTTSLHYYLGLHPQVAMAREKELDFFVLEHNWHRGIAWYKSQFRGNAAVHGEASPRYTYYPSYQGVPVRMHRVVPKAKLIYILRDPIERIVSGYVHGLAHGVEHRTIVEALGDLEANRYVWRSQYYMQLAQYLRCFPQSQILILTLEDLQQHRRRVMRRIFGFLGVDDTFHSVWFSYVKHPSRRKRRLTDQGRRLAGTPLMRVVERWPFGLREKVKAVAYNPFSHSVPRPRLDGPLRQALMEYLSDDIDRLRACTGLAFADWCI